MSDIRSYSAIAEHADPSQLAGQLNTHRAAMNHAILGEGGTVMQFVGDAVMAVFGAPAAQEDHAERALQVALWMQERLQELLARAFPNPGDEAELEAQLGNRGFMNRFFIGRLSRMVSESWHMYPLGFLFGLARFSESFLILKAMNGG